MKLNQIKRPVIGGFVPTSVVEDGALATDALFAPFLKEMIKKIQERFCQKYFALEKIKKMPERLLQTLCWPTRKFPIPYVPKNWKMKKKTFSRKSKCQYQYPKTGKWKRKHFPGKANVPNVTKNCKMKKKNIFQEKQMYQMHPKTGKWKKKFPGKGNVNMNTQKLEN